jgi:hypothetical protein
MRNAIEADLEFSFPYRCAGKIAAEFECRAVAMVKPGEPCRPWQDDPGSGPEVESIRDIQVDVGSWDRDRKRHVAEWVDADQHLEAMILAYLDSGAENDSFEDAANDIGFGPDPDYARELRADRAAE